MVENSRLPHERCTFPEEVSKPDLFVKYTTRYSLLLYGYHCFQSKQNVFLWQFGIRLSRIFWYILMKILQILLKVTNCGWKDKCLREDTEGSMLRELSVTYRVFGTKMLKVVPFVVSGFWIFPHVQKRNRWT